MSILIEQDGAGSVPPRIGRYEIVGQIAMGGMAQLLLARVTGPGGFERAVVLKRILPQYVRVPEFRQMFLDEARIAASIHHRNVVQHYELGEAEDELFLVMEYLEGESASGLSRRCATRGTPLPIALSAHVVAEACAGLHAAHRLIDLDGAPRNVVHRDVSPQNVFVGYDGSVKVIDFGIAKAADRITQTEAGMLKGKYAYMSPEQARGESLDGRSDVFALGIVLYELTTRHRLFHRATPLAALRAVTDDAIPLPSEVVPGYPPALERVCMRALARDLRERYPSALELRNELIEASRALPEFGGAEAAIATLMQTLFADRIEAKHDMLRRMRRGSTVSHVPVDVDVEGGPEPTVAEVLAERAARRGPVERTPVLVATSSSPAAGRRSSRPPPPRRSPAVTWALAVGLIAVLGAAFAWWMGVLPGGRAGAADAITAAAVTAEARDLEASAAPGPEAGAPSSVPAEAADDPGSPSGAASEVAIDVQTTPSGARVLVDGRDVGATPFTLHLPGSTTPVALSLRHEGYEPLETEIVPDVQQRLTFVLTRSRRRPREEAPPSGPTEVSTPPPAGFPRFE